MARWGRGKSAFKQLDFLKGELPAPVLQPPKKYPKLERKALPMTLNTELNYLIELKRDFTEYMRESPNNVLVVQAADIERFSDDLQDAVVDKVDESVDWSKMPPELRPSRLRKRKLERTEETASKRRRVMDVETKFAELEKEESTQKSGLAEEGKEKKKEEEEDAEADENVEIDGQIDEEMDDGTDYVNNFDSDSGESCNDEDDEENMDGAVF